KESRHDTTAPACRPSCHEEMRERPRRCIPGLVWVGPTDRRPTWPEHIQPQTMMRSRICLLTNSKAIIWVQNMFKSLPNAIKSANWQVNCKLLLSTNG